VLGHLVDAASNFHQKLVRGALDELLAFPSYAEDGWVRLQDYQQAPWNELTALWTLYNRHLLRVLARVPAEAWHTPCLIGNSKPARLDAVALDYARHVARQLRALGVATPGDG